MSRDALVIALNRCVNLLQSVGETFWSQKIEGFLTTRGAKLSADDAREVLSWCGGMGSFSDLMISAVNEHYVKPEDEARCNDELDRLRETIYTEASEIL